MGLLVLKRLISLQRQQRQKRRRRQIQARNGSIASVAKRKGSPCQQDGNSQGGKRMRYSGPDLPKDIWCHIHSLMPLRDAARAACVSHAFLRSWRCHPNLTFSVEALGLNVNARRRDKIARDFTSKVDHIMKNHSGIGVKIFDLQFYDCFNTCYLDSWLQIAVTPGIEELTLSPPSSYGEEDYNFPCSLLFGSSGNLIQYLNLSCCAFRPTVGLGCLRSLTRLHLCFVHITGDELGCLLSNSSALEELVLMHCREIICLRIPCLLQHLSYLLVFECSTLQMIESKAPNLSTFHFGGALLQLSLGDSLQVKCLQMSSFRQSHTIHYACAKLPSIVPNLETLSICSASEVSTPIVPVKFLHLKYLSIYLAVGEGPFSPAYDYFSLVSFLGACPVLETFVMGVLQTRMKHDSIFGDSSHLRQMPEYRHDNIKNVEIIGFCSAKSMVELACHILENATSLECLTLDTIYEMYETDRCSVNKIGECSRVGRHMIKEAHKALLAVRRYIAGKVPSTVKLNVLEPCSRCHAFVA